MATLSHAALARAEQYVFTYGRAVDQALYRFWFAGDSAETVLVALVDYQNHDGGFGHALEPDLRCAASSVIATSQAFAVLRDVGAPPDHPLVRGGLRYLAAVYDRAERVWPIVPAAVEDAPHAPWWEFAESATNFGRFRINPSAAVLGHLYHFMGPANAHLLGMSGLLMLNEATDALLAHLDDAETAVGMHDLLCLLGLAAADNVPQPVVDRVAAHARAAAPGLVVTDPAQWSRYGMPPTDAVPQPDALLADVVPADAVAAHLDAVIAAQLPDGSWPLSWRWDFIDADAWAQAERDWKGHLAVQRLRVLRAFGRIAA